MYIYLLNIRNISRHAKGSNKTGARDVIDLHETFLLLSFVTVLTFLFIVDASNRHLLTWSAANGTQRKLA